MSGTRINLHLVSDSTGETLNSVARATVSQFDGTSILHHRWSLIRTRLQLHRVLEGIETMRCAMTWRRRAPGSGCRWSTCSTRCWRC